MWTEINISFASIVFAGNIFIFKIRSDQCTCQKITLANPANFLDWSCMQLLFTCAD